MSDILFCLFYLVLFSVIILRNNWFSAARFDNKYFLGAFYLKLFFGAVLWYIYTHIYKNRLTSDIFKYYDDARIIFGTLHTSVKEYFILLTGIGDSSGQYQDIYHSMNNWVNGYGTVLYSNSHFIIRVNAVFLLFSQGHYGVHIIFMCFLSLAGFTYIYKAFIPFLQEKSKMLFAAAFLFPSVILWSSGVLKEGFIWLGMGISIYYFFQLINSSGISNKLSVVSDKGHLKSSYLISYVIYLLIGFIILFESKAYTLLCIVPCFVSLFLTRKLAYCKAHPLITYVSVLLLYMASSLLPHIFFMKLSPLEMISDKQIDFNRISRGGIYLNKINDPAEYAYIPITDSVNILPLTSGADNLLRKRGVQYLTGNPFWYDEIRTQNEIPFMLRNGSRYNSFRLHDKDTFHLIASDSTAYCVCIYIEPAKSSVFVEPIEPDLKSILTNVLQALKISMLMPYPWKVRSAMAAIYCAENISVLLLIFVSLFFIKRPIPHKDLVLFCLMYCLMMLILIGLVTPILGGIERYKSVVIPFMFILLLLVTDKDRIINTFKFKK